MKLPESNRTTFAQDIKMTPGILSIIARIANHSVTTFKQREEASQKYYKALIKASSEQKQSKERPKNQKPKK
ncbi:MAG: hypothetical protein HY867_03320 [Chloroflexi bacterium]|nr:hypothetical protein [Chloroflexota bacterium]